MVRIGGGEAIPRSVPREDFTPGVSRFQASVNNADHQTELDQYISFMFYITARLLHGLLEKIGINTVLDKSEYSLCVLLVLLIILENVRLFFLRVASIPCSGTKRPVDKTLFVVSQVRHFASENASFLYRTVQF